MKHQHAEIHAEHEVAKNIKQDILQLKDDKAVDLKVNPSDIGRDEMIRREAYSLYEARSCVAGHELDDWLQAEAQVNQMSVQNM